MSPKTTPALVEHGVHGLVFGLQGLRGFSFEVENF